MMQIKIKSNIREVEQTLIRLPEKFRAASEAVIEQIAAYAVTEMVHTAPFATGLLKNSIGLVRLTRQSYEVGIYGPAARYAYFLEKGSKSHIVPIEYLSLHMSDPGTVGSAELLQSLNLKPTGFISVSTYDPFISRAFSYATGMSADIARFVVEQAIS